MTLARKIGLALSVPAVGAGLMMTAPAASAAPGSGSSDPYCAPSTGCYTEDGTPMNAPQPVFNDPNVDAYIASAQECAANVGMDIAGGGPAAILKGADRVVTIGRAALDTGRTLDGPCAEAASIKQEHGPFEADYYTPATPR